jgi:hypothetical protein
LTVDSDIKAMRLSRDEYRERINDAFN